MKLMATWCAVVSLLAVPLGAAAGEDSTHRWHGTGPEFHQMPAGHPYLDPSRAEGTWPALNFEQ